MSFVRLIPRERRTFFLLRLRPASPSPRGNTNSWLPKSSCRPLDNCLKLDRAPAGTLAPFFGRNRLGAASRIRRIKLEYRVPGWNEPASEVLPVFLFTWLYDSIRYRKVVTICNICYFLPCRSGTGTKLDFLLQGRVLYLLDFTGAERLVA